MDYNETPRSKQRGISTKDISKSSAASSGVFTLRGRCEKKDGWILKLHGVRGTFLVKKSFGNLLVSSICWFRIEKYIPIFR